MLCGNLTEHKLWPEIRPYIITHKNNAPNGWRINISDEIPVGVAKRAMKIKVKCSGTNCEKEIHPIREGKAWGALYYSSTCPQTKSIKCSRTKGAVLGCAKVRNALKNQ